MPVELSDADVGLAPHEMSDAEVGLAQPHELSDSDVGLGGVPTPPEFANHMQRDLALRGQRNAALAQPMAEVQADGSVIQRQPNNPEANQDELTKLPQELSQGVETIAAGIGNAPVRAYRAIAGTPRVPVSGIDEQGRPTLDIADKPLPFQAGVPLLDKDVFATKGPNDAVNNLLNKLVKGATTPGNLATLPLTEANIVKAYFLTQTVPAAVQGAKTALDPTKSREERLAGGLEGGVNSLFSFLLGHSAFKEAPKPELQGPPATGAMLKTPEGAKPLATIGDQLAAKGIEIPPVKPQPTQVVGSSQSKNLPVWARSEMERRGLDPNRLLNDIDIKNPSIQKAIESDPTLTRAEKDSLLQYGSLPPKQPVAGSEAPKSVQTPPAPTEAPKVAPVVSIGVQKGAKGIPDMEYYNLTEDIPGHSKGSTLGRKQLERLGYTLPEENKAAQSVTTVPPPLTREGQLQRLKELRSLAEPLANKGGLTASEAYRFKELNAEANSIRFDLQKPLDVSKIGTPQERRSTLANETVATARNDLMRNKEVYTPIVESASGVSHNADTSVDDVLNGKNPKVSERQLYDAFNDTREALRKQFGDTITLFRAEGKQRAKATQNWATTREYAKQFGSKIISKQVPVDDIIAVNVGPSGKYHEVIVRNKGAASLPQPPTEKPLSPESVSSKTAPTGKVEAVEAENATDESKYQSGLDLLKQAAKETNESRKSEKYTPGDSLFASGMDRLLNLAKVQGVKSELQLANTGSQYLILEVPTAFNAEGEATDFETRKYRIANHDASVFREKQFGRNTGERIIGDNRADHEKAGEWLSEKIVKAAEDAWGNQPKTHPWNPENDYLINKEPATPKNGGSVVATTGAKTSPKEALATIPSEEKTAPPTSETVAEKPTPIEDKTQVGKDPSNPSQPVVETKPAEGGLSGDIKTPPAESTANDGSGDTPYGIAERVRTERKKAGTGPETQPGSVPNAEESVENGRKMIQEGVDPESALKHFEETGQSRASDIALVRAQGEKLAKVASDAAEAKGAESPEYKSARDASFDWDKRTKKLQTDWAERGQAQQGHTDLDTGNFHELARAHHEATGKEFTPDQAKVAQRLSKGVKSASDAETAARAKVLGEVAKTEGTPAQKTIADKISAALDKAAKDAYARIRQRAREGRVMAGLDPVDLADHALFGAAKIAKGAIDFGKWSAEMVKDLGDYVKPHLKAIWDAANKEYQKRTASAPGTKKELTIQQQIWQKAKDLLNKGADDFDDIRHKIATEMGIPVKDVTRALSDNQSVKRMSDEMYKRMADTRRLKQQAQAWLKNQQTPGWIKFTKDIPRAFFVAKVFGHGTVGMITHAGMNVFNPLAWKTYWPEFLRQYPLLFNKAYHERIMQDLTRDPNYILARRAGLANDPFKYADDYQSETMKLTMGKLIRFSGTRGFDALKTFRQARFNQLWNAIPESNKTPNMAKVIADAVNHSSGVVKTTLPEWMQTAANVSLFAPKLEMSRWAWLIKDPTQAGITLSNWKNATPEARVQAIGQLKEKAAIAGVYLSLLAANQGLLKASGSKQQVNMTDPTKPDFLSFKVDGHKIGIVGPMIGMVRLFAELAHISMGNRSPAEKRDKRFDEAASAIGKYTRGKASPFGQVVLDAATQADFKGQPLPFSHDKVPANLRREGLGKYTWPRYAADKLAPIPLEEALREVWSNQGLGISEQETYLNALISGLVAGSTGMRYSKDFSKSSTGAR